MLCQKSFLIVFCGNFQREFQNRCNDQIEIFKFSDAAVRHARSRGYFIEHMHFIDSNMASITWSSTSYVSHSCTFPHCLCWITDLFISIKVLHCRNKSAGQNIRWLHLERGHLWCWKIPKKIAPESEIWLHH